eukprot:jgi/Chrzof1/2116/Cz11g03060.t1
MASQLMGSSVRLPTRTPAFTSQQPKSSITRPCLTSSLFGSNISSVSSTSFARIELPTSTSKTGNRRVVTMAAKVTGKIKLELVGGKANPAPPVGPALGSKGVNIMAFCKEYNAQTAKMAGEVIPVEITVYEDRSFTFILKTPPAAVLLKKAAGIDKGAGKPNGTVVGKVTKAQVEEIAKKKMPDTNTDRLPSVMRMIEGTAKSLGLQVEE